MWGWLTIFQNLFRSRRTDQTEAAAPPQLPAAVREISHPQVVVRSGKQRLDQGLPDEVIELTDVTQKVFTITTESSALIRHWRTAGGKVYVLATQAAVLTTIRVEGQVLRVDTGTTNLTLKTPAGQQGIVLPVSPVKGVVSPYRSHYLILVPPPKPEYEDDRTLMG